MATKARKGKKSAVRKAGPPKGPTSVHLINFTTARVVHTKPTGYVLVVSGTKPYLNMQVHLSPLIYIIQPDYWGIEVVGILPTIGLPTTAPYQVHTRLAGITGKKGVEVIGANKRKKINVP